MSDLGSFVKRLRDIMRNDAGINGDAQRIEQIAWMLFLKVYDSQEENWELDIKDYESIIPENLRWRNWAFDDGKGTALTGDKLLNFINNELFPALKNLVVDAETPIYKAIVKTTFEDANQYMKDGVLLRQVLNIIDGVDFGDYEESHAFGDIYESILKELQSAGSAGEFYTPRAVTDFMAEMIKPQIGESMADFACGTGGFIVSWLKELEKKVSTTEDSISLNNSVFGIEKKQFPYMLCVTNMLLHGLDRPNIIHDNSLINDVLDYTDNDKFDVILMNPPYGGSEKNDVKRHFPSDLASSETAELFLCLIMYRLKENGRAAVVLPDGFLHGTDNAQISIKRKLLNDFNLHTIIKLPNTVFSPYTPIRTNLLFFDNTGRTEKTWFYRYDMPSGYKHFSKTKPIEREHLDCVEDWWTNRIEINENGYNKAKCYTYEEMLENNCKWTYCNYPHDDEELLSPQELIREYEEKRASLNADIDRALEFIVGVLNQPEDQIANLGDYDKAEYELADLNASFPDKIKKSIIQYAIQGKLVRQLASDGTAMDLIQQLDEANKKLKKDGIIKSAIKYNVIPESETPFEIPDSWVWTRIGDIVQVNPRNTFIDDQEVGFMPMPLLREGFCNSHSFETRLWEKVKSGFTHFATGDLVVAKITPCFQNRKSAVIKDLPNGIGAGTTELHVLRDGTGLLCMEYLLLVLKTSRFINDGIDHFTGTAGQQRIGKEFLRDYLIPLPPYNEQVRIVKKVYELIPSFQKD